MSQIIDNGAGTYTFSDAAALKTFLLIENRCLGKGKNRPCKVTPKKAINATQPQLEKVVRAGFPSGTAASELRKVAYGCICNNNHAGVLSGHGEVIPQDKHLYNEWNHKLWMAYRKKNDVSDNLVDKEVPSLGDPTKWEEALHQLKRQSPAQTGMYTDLSAISRNQLTLMQQIHLTQDENPSPLNQPRATALVGG